MGISNPHACGSPLAFCPTTCMYGALLAYVAQQKLSSYGGSLRNTMLVHSSPSRLNPLCMWGHGRDVVIMQGKSCCLPGGWKMRGRGPIRSPQSAQAPSSSGPCSLSRFASQMTASPIPSGMQDDADLMLPEEFAEASLGDSGEGSGGSDEIEDDKAQVRLPCQAMPCNNLHAQRHALVQLYVTSAGQLVVLLWGCWSAKQHHQNSLWH